MKKSTFFPFLLLICFGLNAQNTIRLDQLNLSNATTGWGTIKKNLSIDGNPLKINGTTYSYGVGTHSASQINLFLYGTASRFQAIVGVDDETVGGSANLEFQVIGDGATLFTSGIMNYNTPSKTIDINTSGINILKLIVNLGSDGVNWSDHADWCNATLTYNGVAPITTPITTPSTNGSYFPVYPFGKDFSKILVTKFLIDGGKTANPPIHVDSVLRFFRDVDNLTRGVPKICSIVGWQNGGHDHMYPLWGPVNPALKRKQNNTALESIHYLMNTAKSQYHCDASLHVNWSDGYADSPMWAFYVANDWICKNSDGTYVKTWFDSANNRQGYAMNLKKLWEAGRLQQQIDSMILQFPQLLDGALLTDANVYYASPFHSISANDQKIAYAKAIQYAHQKGLDMHAEYGADSQSNMYGMTPVCTVWGGSQPMSIAPYIACGGSDNWGTNQELKVFGNSCQLESMGTNSSTILETFAHSTVPYFYLNSKLRISYDAANAEAIFSDGVKSFVYNQTTGENRIRSRWIPDGTIKYLFDNGNGKLFYGSNPVGDSFIWNITDINGIKRIQNKATGNFINIQNALGTVECSPYIIGKDGFDWRFVTVEGSYFNIQNTWASNPYSIHFEHQTNPLEYGIVYAYQYSPQWMLEAVAGIYPTGAQVITQNDNLVRVNDDMFIPLGWRNNREIFAYSGLGATKTWTFPPTWNDVTSVDIYKITNLGTVLLQSGANVSSHKITLTIPAKQGQIVVPMGVNVSLNVNSDRTVQSQVDFIKADDTLKGTWKNIIGTDGYDIAGIAPNLPSYASISYVGTTDITWNVNSSDVRALQKPGTSTERIAGSRQCELHQIFNLTVTGSAKKKVSLYFLDWEAISRQTLVEVIDANSGKVLNTQIINSYQDGKYLQYAILGNVQIRLTKFLNENMVMVGNPSISGIFFDPYSSSEIKKIDNPIQFYPNPVNHLLTIKSTNNIESVKITNMKGQCVKQFKPFILGNQIEIDVSDLVFGVYFAEIANNKTKVGFKFTKK